MFAQSTGGLPGQERCDRMEIAVDIHDQCADYFHINFPDPFLLRNQAIGVDLPYLMTRIQDEMTLALFQQEFHCRDGLYVHLDRLKLNALDLQHTNEI